MITVPEVKSVNIFVFGLTQACRMSGLLMKWILIFMKTSEWNL